MRISIRISLVEAIGQVMKLGTGMPRFNNDEVIIPSFIEKGVKEGDADNYFCDWTC